MLFHLGLLPGGFVGVDVFFVISGYVITRRIRREIDTRSFTLRGFYIGRLRRIYPALLATIIVTLMAGTLVLSPNALVELGWSALASSASVANIQLWLQSGYFDAASFSKPLLHTWSLGVEEQFYLLWPVLLVAFRWPLVAIALLAVASFAAAALWGDHASAVFYLTPFRLFQFGVGAGLTWATLRTVPWLTASAIAGLTACYWYLNEKTAPLLAMSLPTLATAAIIWFGSDRGPVNAILTNRVSQLLGRISYSIYLVHWPIIVFSTYVFGLPTGTIPRLPFIVASIVGGYLLHRVIEQQFHRPRPGREWLLVPSLAGSLAIIVGSGLLFVQSAGMPWRLGAQGDLYRQIVASDGIAYGGIGCTSVWCERGTGEPIYLIGDSHARALFAGFAGSVVAITAPGCPIWSDDIDLGPYTDECIDAREALKRVPRGARVVLAQNWHGSDGATRIAGLRDRLAINLVVVANVPGTNVAPLHCLGRPFVKGEDCFSTPRERAVDRESVNHDLALILNAAGIAVFDPFDSLCTETACDNIDGEGVIYFDTNHLSVHGAMRVVSTLLAL